jgi:adenosylcobinamide-phosphate synthase
MFDGQFLLLAGGLAAGILLDIVLGDPRNRYHPVSWLGIAVQYAIPQLKYKGNAVSPNFHTRNEKINGIVFSCSVIIVIALLIEVLAYLTVLFLSIFAALIVFAILLKISIALNGMERCVTEIIRSVQVGDLGEARYSLSMIVRRDTKNLNEKYILSATIECISESTVDGIISPLFFYSILGPMGCIAFRVVNTLDSLIGYKDPYFKDIGWMSAKLDTIFNFLPARITGYLMVVSAVIVQADWKNSLLVLLRDHHITSSVNAGYPMSSMAGALRVKLEKLGSYSLGDEIEQITIEKCMLAVKIMKITTALFCLAFSLPLLLMLSYMGWWVILFGI